jgi:hypothetical protein
LPRHNKHAQSRWSPGSRDLGDLKHLDDMLHRDAFHWAAKCQHRCQHPSCTYPSNQRWDPHHVIYQQHIRLHDKSYAVVWDKRNALRLCTDCHHNRQHNKSEPVPVSALPLSVIEFSVELMGRGPTLNYLHAYYAADCDVTARVDDFLVRTA